MREHGGGGGETEQPSRSPEGTRSNRAARKGANPRVEGGSERARTGREAKERRHQPRRDPPRGHAGGLPA